VNEGTALDEATLTGMVGRFVERQRWFTGKAWRIATVDAADWGWLPAAATGAILLLDVGYEDGGTERFFVPVSVAEGEAAGHVRQETPALVVAPTGDRPDGVLHGRIEDDIAPAMLSMLATSATMALARGRLEAVPTRAFPAVMGGAAPTALAARRVSGEQSNTSVLFGDRLVMKVIRRLQPGVSPDVEVGRHLTERVAFTGSPRLAGWIDHVADDGTRTTLVVAHEFVAGGRDSWETSVEAARAWIASVGAGEGLGGAERALAGYARWAQLLGRRTAELHTALAAGDDPAFAPEPAGRDGLAALAADLQAHGAAALDALAGALPGLPAAVTPDAVRVLASRDDLLGRLAGVRTVSPALARIRVHGDYHLGQVLATPLDLAILDFEGEPLRPVEERRTKQLALKDVAGMVRSFGYAAYAALFAEAGEDPAALARLEPAALAFEGVARTAFLEAYRAATAGARFVPRDDAAFGTLLAALVADKALYELVYEINNRPAWLRIPLRGLAATIAGDEGPPGSPTARGRT
jgi:maltose alpha-D-glucosyltransferase/alpha-amylase